MFIIELVPPKSKENLSRYYEKISNLINQTNSVNIASKPREKFTSGFDLSINLVKFLLDNKPDIDIIFHVTCRDLHKKNIEARLRLLRDLKIKKILVVSGDKYERPDEDHYSNSKELLESISRYDHCFSSIAVAGYPGGNGLESHDNDEECDRLQKVIEMGANAIYTQCVFDSELFRDFHHKIKDKCLEVEVVPSIALFESRLDLEKIATLTRINKFAVSHLIDDLDLLTEREAKEYSLKYSAQLCTNLSSPAIDICAFGKFDMAEKLIAKTKSSNKSSR